MTINEALEQLASRQRIAEDDLKTIFDYLNDRVCVEVNKLREEIEDIKMYLREQQVNEKGGGDND